MQNIDLPPLNNANNAQYFLRKPDKVVEEDQRVFSAYQDCTQLQLQLNLAHYAVQRLRVALGAVRKSLHTVNAPETQELIHHSSTEQLRTIIQYLLDTLLSLLHSNNGEQPEGTSFGYGDRTRRFWIFILIQLLIVTNCFHLTSLPLKKPVVEGQQNHV